jgi:hypothetical protein
LINGKIYSQALPCLFEYAKDPKISLWKLRNADNLLNCFRIPMSRNAFNEFLALQEELGQFQTVTLDMKDEWVYIWGNQSFSSNRYYKYHFSSLLPLEQSPGFGSQNVF